MARALYAESFSDNLTQAYPYADGLMALHYRGAYIGAAVGDIVFVAGRRHLGSALSG